MSFDDQKSGLDAREERNMKTKQRVSFFLQGDEKFWKTRIVKDTLGSSNQKGSLSGAGKQAGSSKNGR